jgi:DNA (cytosine-5)-methyltransferase 1
MTHGSLFSGIGGFDLAAEWAGWENVFHCEWNEFGQKVLKYHFPQSITYNDITKTDFTIHRGQIDVLTGGFPCQPYSSAGKRLGTADNRHLWPEMLREIREIQPRWIVGENVRGLTNWNGGMVFDEVQLDLEVEGYEIIPFLLPACAVNAPHRRDRIWFVASNSMCERYTRPTSCGVQKMEKRETFNNNKRSWNNKRNYWINFPTQPFVCGGNDGLSRSLDGITFSKWRKETIKAYGNAIVPQVAFQIFNSINQYEKGH